MLRDPERRAGCQLQREDRDRQGQQQRDPAGEEHDWPVHDRVRQPRPHALLGVAAAREPRNRQVQARAHELRDRDSLCPLAPVDREQRGLKRHRRGDRHERDQEAADPHRAHERRGHEEQQREPDCHRRPGEDDRPPRRRHRPHDRVVLQAVPRQFLAEAVDDQQGVVDRDPQPDQLDEVRHVRRHRDVVSEGVDRAEGASDRTGGEQQRDRHGPGKAEDEEQHEQRDRDRDLELALLQVLVEDRVEVVLDRRLASDVRMDEVPVR